MIKKLLILGSLIAGNMAFANAEVGQQIPDLTLSGDEGGKVSGGDWSSSELMGKMHLIVYSDFDNRDLNNDAAAAVKAAKFPKESFSSVAVMNMLGVNWLMAKAVEVALMAKQQQYPETLFVKDNNGALINVWGLEDHNNDMLLVGADGKVLFVKQGALSNEDTDTLLATIRDNLPK